MIRIRGLFFALILMVVAAPVFAAEYEADPAHTSVSFKVHHLLAFVNGSFDKVEARFTYVAGKPEEWKVEAKIKADSVSTKFEQRDNHLKSNEFLDVEKFPEITFKSTKVTDFKDGHAKLHGLLSIHGVEREVVLDLDVIGEDKDPWGNELAGFSARTVISRKDFGLVWNQIAESGHFLVGEEVFINIDVEGKTVTAQAPEARAAAAEEAADVVDAGLTAEQAAVR